MTHNKFLLVKGSSGLGNRILCALTGILYARLAGRRLVIDWSDEIYSNGESNVFHSFFQCSSCRPTDEMPVADSVSPIIWRGHLYESADYMRRQHGTVKESEMWREFSIDLTNLDYREDIVVMWTYNAKVDSLRGHFKGALEEFAQASTEAILSKLLREDLILHPQIRERVAQFKHSHFNKTTVGVHVRYTDHRTRLWAALKKLDVLLKQEPELQIFLSTDNIQIKNVFEENYPNVLSTPHRYSRPGWAMHRNLRHLSPVESGVEALVDLYLLAECNYLIIDTSSSFSYVAKLLAKTTDSRIFDVQQRKKLPVPVRRFTWRLMVRLGLFSWGLSLVSKFVKMRRFFNKQLGPSS